MKKFAIALVFVALAACGGSDAGTWVVTMQGHTFEPASMTVRAGETVTWSNDTDEAHTVTAEEDSLPTGAGYFSSGRAADEDAANGDIAGELIQPGDSFEWTFEKPGTYRYYCIPHKADGMVGSVVVE